ncbi:hypothetical protein [Paraflavitalea speifideaquila]|uniref:hypothetical protein n=1 Tax=Paraflavitalea speifideaquila TaxID=3076558 RepID=UPI0028EB688B|nr:hypothetical protein [Paraflavitalea speifideiaquila]
MKTKVCALKACLVIVCLQATLMMLAQDKPLAGKLFPRIYKVGDKYHYRLTAEQFYNNQWNGTSVVVMECTVVKDSAGIAWDEVRSLSKTLYSPKDTVNMDEEALAVKPYRISLHPRGQLLYPASRWLA